MSRININKTGAKEVAQCEPYAKLLKDFLTDRAPGTLRSYTDDIDGFRKWMKHRTITQTVKWLLTRNSAQAALLTFQYRASLIRNCHSPASINRAMTVLRQLIDCGRASGLVDWTLQIRNVKNVRFEDTRGTGICGVETLITAAEKQEFRKAIRDKVIVELLYTLSLSRVALAKINFEDCDFERSMISVAGEADLKNPIRVPPRTLESLKNWRKVRGDGLGPLFIRMNSTARLTANGMYRVLKSLAKRAGTISTNHDNPIMEALPATCEKLRSVS